MKNLVCSLKIATILLIIIESLNCQNDKIECPKNIGCTCQSISVLCSKADLNEIPTVPSSTQILDLRLNNIRFIRPGIFRNLNRLKTLYLNSNQLKSLESDSFFGLNELQDLFLHNNYIERVHSRAFSRLVQLKNLYLQQNKIREIEPGTFSVLNNLERLFLGQNQLTRFREELIRSNPNLKNLQIEGNNLVCNCDSFWLWDAVNPSRNSQRIYNFKLTASCASPPELNNKNLLTLQIKDFKCEVPMITLSPKNVEIEVGQPIKEAKFECKAKGNPRPRINWYKNSLKLLNNKKYSLLNENSVLIIKDVNKNDAGNYECVASSKVGENKTSAMLKFNEKIEQFEDVEFEINNDYYDVSEFEINEEQNPANDDGVKARYDDRLKFTLMPSDLTLIEGSDAHFVCRTNDPRSRINWLKEGVELVENHRYSILSNGDLEIRNARVEDEGFFICQISNSEQIKYAQAQLIVNVAVAFLKRPLDLEIAQGNTGEFHCSVAGKPTPTIEWKKDGKKIKPSNDSSAISHYEFYQNNQLLRINDLVREDSGIYTCTANNSISSISSSARLIVTRSTPPYFRILQQNISVFEDHPITLECFAHGDPKPQMLWYKNGQRIATDSRLYFDSYGYLAITQVRIADSGEYLCRAENVAGFATHKFYLSVKDIYGTIISNTIIKEAIQTAKNEVNKQFQNTLNSLNDKRKPKTSADLIALLRFPKDKTLSLVISEEIYERALDIIFRYANNITFNLTDKSDFVAQQILTHRQLQRISDLSGCHRHKRIVQCSQRCLNYRTFDGSCNNLEVPLKGAANTPLKRLLSAEYQNGFSTPRGWNKSQLYNGFMLPNARDVSTRIITTSKITHDRKFSHMLMQWGQFLDHDLDHTVMALSLNRFSNGIACRDSCSNDQPCFPIEVMANDTLRAHLPGKCMEFVRSSAVCGTGETSLVMNKIHQREQINQLTAFIDASNVYGSNDQDAFDIRERVINSGKLKVHVTPKYPKGILPFNQDTNMDCQRENTSTIGCFMAGDYRANEQLALLAMHNLWVRQHNRLADNLRKLNPHWSPEQIYQETRKIVGAQMQIITYESWLPYILGPTGIRMLGKFKAYDPNIDPTISNEFATAAFRFGHALIQPFTFRLNESYQPIPEGNLLLRDSFFSPQRYYYEGAMDPLLRGLYGVAAKLKMPREIMNNELTEKLFHIVRSVSQDLAALNIQRGRDHGLPSYAAYRRFCNMSDVNDFEDLKKEISSKQVRLLLKQLYGDVRNIDIWPGGILEDVVPGSKLGPLFMCIIVKQFKEVRDGDRFWYENPGVFTPAQLTELRKTNLAKVICENGDNINLIQRDAFLNADYPNEMVECSEIQDVSLEPWRNCCEDNAKGLCEEPAYFYVPADSQFKSKQRKKRELENFKIFDSLTTNN